MQGIREYADSHGITVGELFDLSWRSSHYNNRCTTGEVVRDVQRYEKSKGKVIPVYVSRYLKQQTQQVAVMPSWIL